MKSRKRLLILIMPVVLALMLVVLALLPANVQAAGKKAKAVKAYQNYMEKQSGSSKFALVYLDKDSVPELIYAVPNQFIYKIYTWKSGKMKLVYSCNYSNKDTSNGHNISYYYRKKGVFVSKAYTGAVGCSGRLYFQYNGKKYKNTLCKSTYPGGSNYQKVTGSKFSAITSAQFKKQLKSAVGSKKMTKIKYYKNTEANRVKYLK